MIEVLIDKSKNKEATYNLYQMESMLSQKWKFIKTLNLPESNFNEWHHKSFFPYNVDLKTLTPMNKDRIKGYDTFKLVSKNKVKILNT